MAFIETFFKITDSQQIYLFRHFFNFLIFFVSLFFFFKIINNRYESYAISILGVLFLIFSPRIFAESFYNTKDICFMSFFIINLFTAINFLEKPSIKNSIIFAIISSLAVGLRILGIFLPILIILIFLIDMLRNNFSIKNQIIPLIIFLISFPLFLVFFWPYLWSDPVGNFLEVFNKLGNLKYTLYNFYFGEYINAQSVPWHYTIVWIFITTPIFYLILFLMGAMHIFYRFFKRLLKIEENYSYKDLWRGKKELQDLIFFLTFFIPLFMTIYLNSTLYDGWRHLYFIYPSFLMLSLYGLNIIKNLFFKNKKIYIYSFSILLILPTFFWMYSNHPFQNVYFNLLARKNFHTNFEMDYWGTSNKKALQYIASKTKEKVNVYNLNTSDLLLSRKILDEKNRNLINVVYDPKKANYIVNSFRDWNGVVKPQDYSVPKNFVLVYEIKVDDTVINAIYEKKM